jgi:hypothetical protein
VEEFGLTEYHILQRNTRTSLCGVRVDLRDGHTVATNSREVMCQHCLRLVYLQYSVAPVAAERRLFFVHT